MLRVFRGEEIEEREFECGITVVVRNKQKRGYSWYLGIAAKRGSERVGHNVQRRCSLCLGGIKWPAHILTEFLAIPLSQVGERDIRPEAVGSIHD